MDDPTLQLILTTLMFMKYLLGEGPMPEAIEKKLEWNNDIAVKWSLDLDCQLCDVIDSMKISNLLEMNLTGIKLSESQKLLYPALAELSPETIQDRIRVLKEFNLKVSKILPYIDITNMDSTFVQYYHKLKPVVFQCIKTSFIDSIVKLSDNEEVVPTVNLNRIQTMIDSGSADPVFMQLFRQLKNSNSNFKNPKKFFGVEFEGEEGYDDGGPFRDSLESAIADVTSPSVGLFILCPNGRKSHGRNRDK